MEYQELVRKYQARTKSALTDGIAMALSHLDEVSVELGLMEDTGLLGETLGALSVALPFVVIAVTEQGKVVLGRKTQKAAMQDASFRMLKTGAGLAAGAAAMGAGLGALPAIPIAVGVRMLLENYRSTQLTAHRVRQRTERLRALSEARRTRGMPSVTDAGATALTRA
ncbi:MAG TPA: hypothetical protein VLA21_09600 [Candidatus Limnocylindria bacterium]|nr:hypothetical protein [Candidatus Limnocylindria bacterium]